MGRHIAALAAALVLAIAPAAEAAFDVGTGRNPQVVADPGDGTAYVVWTENSRGGGAKDYVHFCRIAAGQQACDRAREFSLVDSGDQEGAIVRDPLSGALHVVVNVFGGTGKDGTYLITSTDGGATFAPEKKVGTGLFGLDEARFGPGQFRVATMTEYEGGGVQAPPLDGVSPPSTYARPLEGQEGVDVHLANVDPTTLLLAKRNGGFDGTLSWSTFTGNGNPSDKASWSAPATATGIASDFDLGGNGQAAPVLAGFEGGFSDQRLVVRRFDKGANGFGPPATAAAAPGALRAAVDLDPVANVHLFFVSGSDPRNLMYLSSADGTTWPATAQVLSANDAAVGLESAAGNAGTGAAVWETGGSGANATIRAALITGPGGFPAAPPPGDGPAHPGGTSPPPPACGKAPVLGIAQLKALAGCFSGSEPKLSITTPFLVNGVKVDPKGKAAAIDTAKRTITMPAGSVASIDPITIAKGERTWTFPASGEYTVPGVFDLDKAGYGAQLLGLDVVGDTRLVFTSGQSRLAAHLTMPDPFDTVTADVTFKADNVVGLRFDGLKAHVDELPYGFRDLNLEYVTDPPTWAGSVQWKPPSGGGDVYDGSFRIVDGKLEFDRITGRFGLPGKQIYPPYVYLPYAGIELRNDPLRLRGEVVLTGGPSTSVGAVVGVGQLDTKDPTKDDYATITLTLTHPFKIEALGPIYVLGYKIGQGYLKYTYPLDIAFGANAEIGTCGAEKSEVGASAKFDGWLAASKDFAFSLEAEANVCAGLKFSLGKAILSSKGVAACAGFLVFEAGIGHKWADPIDDIDVLFPTCKLDDYRPAAAAQAGGGQGFTVGSGVKKLQVRLKGSGGAPQAALVAPDGKRYDPPRRSGLAPTDQYFAYADADEQETTFGINAPAAGRWTIEPDAGSPAISDVDLARDAPDVRVRGTVTRKGARRELRYTIDNARAGQVTTFVAQGGGTLQRLGTASGRQGVLRFTPRTGPGGKRTIYAVIDRDDLPLGRPKVATFTVPSPPRVTRAAKLKATHKGTAVKVTWRPGRAVVRQEVLVRLGDGTAELHRVSRRARSLTVKGVRGAVTGRVTVTGFAYDGKAAPRATAKVRAAARKKAKRRR
ncbi:MAG: hypothetical protein HZB46_13100 [Solirubrobacterales bacterium]|nr:hypothetical protein [Solirubrobacterales bacterium]